MKKTYTHFALAIILTASPLAAGAASLIDIGYGSSAQSRTSVPGIPNTGVISVDRSDLELNAEARGNANADAPVSNQANVSAGVDANVNGNTDSSANTGNGINGNAGVNANSNANAGENRQNTGLPNATSTSASATGQLNASAQSNLNMTAEMVATEEDLRAYALASMEADENLNSMIFETNRVVVKYNDKGRFIGIIPVDVAVTVSVDQDGEVEIDYPWYGFLIADKGDIESRIRSEVDASVSANAEGWTNFDRAQLAQRIALALRAHYQAEAGTNATSTDSND